MGDAGRRKRKLCWSTIVHEQGLQVRVFERTKGGPLYRSIVLDGVKHRKSLNHRDREQAVEQARAFARALAARRLTGFVGRVMLGQLFAAYDERKGPLLSANVRSLARARARLFELSWGAEFDVLNLSQTDVELYCAARRAGKLTPFQKEGKGRRPVKVRDGTLDSDFRWLSSVFNWAHGEKVQGRRLLSENPLHDLTWPKEKNVLRPVASAERYHRTLEHVDRVDARGRLRCMLIIARHSGRRESAICELRTSDVLLTTERIREVLAATGRDERWAEAWPLGAIRWRSESDKQGYDEIAPMSAPVREAIEGYLRANPRLGEAPLFPAPGEEESSMRRDVAGRWLLKAEKLAGLPKLKGGVWHPYRRLWAVERKGLPDHDVAAAGGWRDTRALRQSYQQADPETMRRVVDLA